MTDISLAWSEQAAQADWQILNGDIATGGDLLSAVIVSLFSDRHAAADYQGTDPRGWWGDSFSPTPLGSRLWTLERSTTNGVLLKARDYCNEALRWMIDDGVAASITVNTSWLSSNALRIAITITQPTGVAPVFNFSWAWAAV